MTEIQVNQGIEAKEVINSAAEGEGFLCGMRREKNGAHGILAQ